MLRYYRGVVVMTTYTFEIVLATESFSDKDADRLFEHGGDDATPVTREGVTRLVFDRQAESLEQAIASASADTRAADLSIARIELAAPTQHAG